MKTTKKHLMRTIVVVYSLIIFNSLAVASDTESEYMAMTKDQTIRTNNIINNIMLFEKITDITTKTSLKVKELNFMQLKKGAIIDVDNKPPIKIF